MPIAMHHEDGNLFRIALRGTLRKADFDRCQQTLVAEMARLGPVRLLFVLEEFGGWARGDNWRDMSFYVTYGSSIQRIAIVGPEEWRAQSLMFAGADLRTAPVEFFPADAAADARTWVQAP